VISNLFIWRNFGERKR